MERIMISKTDLIREIQATGETHVETIVKIAREKYGVEIGGGLVYAERAAAKKKAEKALAAASAPVAVVEVAPAVASVAEVAPTTALVQESNKAMILRAYTVGLDADGPVLEPSKIIEKMRKLHGRETPLTYVYKVLSDFRKYSAAPKGAKKGRGPAKVKPVSKEFAKVAVTAKVPEVKAMDRAKAILLNADRELRMVMDSMAQKHGLNALKSLIEAFEIRNSSVEIRITG